MTFPSKVFAGGLALLVLSACSGGGRGSASLPAPQVRADSSLTRYRGTVDTFKLLYSFGTAKTDGRSPEAELVPLHDRLYGTTAFGPSFYDFGTVFSITPAGEERTVHAFAKSPNGATPVAALVASSNREDPDVLVGTTSRGGKNDKGVAFSVTPAGKYAILQNSFGDGSSGRYPEGRLERYSNGDLYGTTREGGSHGGGTVFDLDTGATTYSFGNASDGSAPRAGLTLLGATLWGTTTQGGGSGHGTVFAVSGSGQERVIYSFRDGADGAYPKASLLAHGFELYGTTSRGGPTSRGIVFEINQSGAERVLYNFHNGDDGAWPRGALVYSDGWLYGTTAAGGIGCPGDVPFSGCGTIFAVNASTGEERILHRFTTDRGGRQPNAGLTLYRGLLYGVTSVGGAGGGGTVFEIAPEMSTSNQPPRQ